MTDSAENVQAEHQVVVVFDVLGADLLDAGQIIAKHLGQTRTRLVTIGVDSWWMPEEPLRSAVDRNDNTPMVLVPDNGTEVCADCLHGNYCSHCGAHADDRHRDDCKYAVMP
jgi:hypothetical protein